jgi:acetyl-CoA synthetase
MRVRLAPYKRIRRLEFSDLPKTISGKIRRADLRMIEQTREPDKRNALEFFDDDFRPEESVDSKRRRPD